MKQFMDDHFLLTTPTAQHLFYAYAASMPICDYHCHLSPKEIYYNEAPGDLAELWLAGDHYKWRAMRSCGFGEDYCTGGKSGEEKFLAFAKTVQFAIGNPLYHWTHLELQRYFQITTPLNEHTAPKIWNQSKQVIAQCDFRPRSLIQQSNVKVICTTDDPADSLEYHKLLAADPTFPVKILPTFRPDKALQLCSPEFPSYLKKLGNAAGTNICTPADLIHALEQRMEVFHQAGCRVSDQSFSYVPYREAEDTVIDTIFAEALDGAALSEEEIDAYQTHVMLALGKKYHQLGWGMELHMGALRNNNTPAYQALGPDTGFDAIDDARIAAPLSRFLDTLEQTGQLPKTVLFNLHPKDNAVVSAIAGNFQTGDGICKIQFGPAWWFLDTLDGMTAQLKQLASTGILGKFIGMETDSRSFTSYARHEYFRRILCEIVGQWVENGMYENNETLLKKLIEGICYNNAMNYFNF